MHCTNVQFTFQKWKVNSTIHCVGYYIHTFKSEKKLLYRAVRGLNLEIWNYFALELILLLVACLPSAVNGEVC